MNKELLEYTISTAKQAGVFKFKRKNKVVFINGCEFYFKDTYILRQAVLRRPESAFYKDHPVAALKKWINANVDIAKSFTKLF